MRLTLIAAATVLAAAGCTGANDCESFADALCAHDSFTSDDDPARAAQRTDDCTCMKDGPDGLETEFKKMACVSRREYLKNLDDRAEFAARTLDACRAARAVLDEYQDRYIEICVQSGGTEACEESLDACAKGCADDCATTCTAPGDYGDCNDCLTPCLADCAYAYPCDQMCSVFDFDAFGPGYGGGGNGGGGGGGGAKDAGVEIPCLDAAEGDDCTGGYCVQRSGYMTCSPACPKVGVGCAAGYCYYLDPGNACTVPGSQIEGEPCGGPHDCVGGVQCLERGGTTSCFAVCSNDNGCTSPKVCTDTDLGFKVCAVP